MNERDPQLYMYTKSDNMREMSRKANEFRSFISHAFNKKMKCRINFDFNGNDQMKKFVWTPEIYSEAPKIFQMTHIHLPVSEQTTYIEYIDQRIKSPYQVSIKRKIVNNLFEFFVNVTYTHIGDDKIKTKVSFLFPVSMFQEMVHTIERSLYDSEYTQFEGMYISELHKMKVKAYEFNEECVMFPGGDVLLLDVTTINSMIDKINNI